MGSEIPNIWTNQCFIDSWAEAKELKKMHDQEINEAVARKLGWQSGTYGTWVDPHGILYISGDQIPDYCHDIQVAWEIVDYLRKRRGLSSLNIFATSKSFRLEIYWDNNNEISDGPWQNTISMAICLAFLKLP